MHKETPPAEKGRRIVGGVVVSWGAQIVQIISGFMVPRWIDHDLGPEVLGIWDFGWTLVSYLGLLEAGIGSSVNRHVALHFAQGDNAGLNRVVSSVAMMQRAVGVVVLVLTLCAAWSLPLYLHNLGATRLIDARWMVIILGLSVALSFSGAIYTGVLTGRHRWALHHSIYVLTNILSALGMYFVLAQGLGIVALAAVYLGSELLGRVMRAICAYRTVPDLSIGWSHADRGTIREMFSFGGRMFVGRMSQVFMMQTINILIVSFLGPASLALFVRPRSLLRQITVFPQKYAFMLVPAAAALSHSSQSKIGTFVKLSTRSGVYMSLPVLIFIAIEGDLLLQFWMGGRYVDPQLMLLLVFAFAAEVVYQPLNNLLLGLNLHGRPGMYSMAAAAFAIGCSFIALKVGGGLHVIAMAIAVPWSIAHGILLPTYACRRLHIPVKEFLREVWAGPLLCMIPFAFILLLVRSLFAFKGVWALIVPTALGGAVLGVCYWIWVLPASWKQRVMKALKLAAAPLFGKASLRVRVSNLETAEGESSV